MAMLVQAWKSARLDEIEQQKAIQLEYDWTYTTPYCGTVVPPAAGPAESSSGSTTAGANGTAEAETAAAGGHAWEATTEQVCSETRMQASGWGRRTRRVLDAFLTNPRSSKHRRPGYSTFILQVPLLTAMLLPPAQIDRSLLMERDPIIFFDEVILYESDLDDNGVWEGKGGRLRGLIILFLEVGFVEGPGGSRGALKWPHSP